MSLDNIAQIRKLDKEKVDESIELLPDQIRQVLQDSHLIKIPREYKNVTEVVINGMGGSNLGAGIIKAAFADKLRMPISISPGYNIPEHVNKDTLYLISSYSGTTEEPLSTYLKAKKKGAKLMAITSNDPKSKLAKLMIKDDVPGYIFSPDQNPCGQPRIGLGYSVFGMAVLLAKSGIFEIQIKEIEDIIARMEIFTRKIRVDVPTNENIAKKIAIGIYGKQPIIVGAEFLMGNLRILRNQFCESGKNFASYLSLPELNHYAMEGLIHPESNKKNLLFFFVNSKLYHKRIQKRLLLTKKVVEKNHIKTMQHNLSGKTKTEQAFEFMQLGTWISYYLGILNNADPVKIPWVDWFKSQLK
ncbi:hypothetical protein A2331_06170 [Candidatus Falkowbacteria bacterium RIFOXYB2_FULL_34_18]|uniref:SIS domain-containing protein n=1 Tax=Candidatus Falkowbacteria bacterium RIFOXYD2_FULL_34_120 TaxID=1798007 RepID=A0A1F5TNC7_9BACT|nr:MAG: hypothetical protein A2331_06170 [Candidatus Falkowbacteria bacterium RIFOXYB2_FULL_34_18]OGF28780.1 MAG: hypothetical protein A2500_04530 [Candidatus Falkowbacteria bacterium RIFOXYC12_FULL_34_55]OGF35693.1 MAG: hypothetical protein A2466_05035 [Candidatus Falkowbacteria bacterium RIFOXYC2_FULL_34_220]OGF38408.1 MAG: hypothetical protein A2515_00525 [Candidatus Falkowbacteria bacterium RIFOXYD12_FULL_34_57]OGF40463.1 MAG: hypothetical protein A2531_03005 [Candidatus Falkowbacteria bact